MTFHIHEEGTQPGGNIKEPRHEHSINNTRLRKLDARVIVEELGPNAVLLCWEAPGEFCHRRLVADWLETELGIEVPELG